MYNILIWGTGIWYDNYITLIKYFESEKQFHIVGVTSNDNYYSTLDGYPFIPKNNLADLRYDWIIVCATKNVLENIRKEAVSMGIPEDIILSAHVLQIPNFNFEKYVNISNSKVSIIANNCWGGIVYHRLGLRVRSPIYNMAFAFDEGYLSFLKNAKDILLNEKLQFQKMEREEHGVHDFPVYKLSGIEIKMIHYRNREEVENKWYERVERLNWDNLFVMMYTNTQKYIEEFSRLPYKKKVCFTSLNVDIPYAYNLPLDKICPERKLWEIVNYSAEGSFKLYDLMDMLLSGYPSNHRIVC